MGGCMESLWMPRGEYIEMTGLGEMWEGGGCRESLWMPRGEYMEMTDRLLNIKVFSLQSCIHLSAHMTFLP